MKRFLLVGLMMSSYQLTAEVNPAVIANVGKGLQTLATGTAGKALSPKNKERVLILAETLQGSAGVVTASNKVVADISKLQPAALKLKNQLNCIKTKAAGCDCTTLNGCIARALRGINEFLQPLIDDILGKVTITVSQGKETTELQRGALLSLLNLPVIKATPRGQDYSTKLQKFTTELYSMFDLIEMLVLAADPEFALGISQAPGAPQVSEEAKQAQAEEPTVIEESFDF